MARTPEVTLMIERDIFEAFATLVKRFLQDLSRVYDLQKIHKGVHVLGNALIKINVVAILCSVIRDLDQKFVSKGLQIALQGPSIDRYVVLPEDQVDLIESGIGFASQFFQNKLIAPKL